MTTEIILWISAGLLIYTFVAYPVIVLSTASLIKDKDIRSDVSLPGVSILMPAHNEERVMRAKIEALLSSHYPPDKMEIIVGSDASTDSTDKIVLEYACSDNRIVLIRSESRIGKPAMLNLLVSKAKGEIVVITDANVIPDKETLKHLASRFFSPAIGLCDASVTSPGVSGEGVSRQEKLYQSFETLLKRSEGRLSGAMSGPYGGFYAARKVLFPVLPENMLVDDLYAGLTVLQKGFRSINVKEAAVTEDHLPGIRDQYIRRVRIAAGSFQNLFHFGPFPGKGFMPSLCFFSHKVLRWFAPFLMILFFMTTVILSGHSDLYFCLLAAQLIFIFLSAIDMVLYGMGKTLRPLRYITQFIMMNAALVSGFFRALSGIKEGTWEPTKRVYDE